MGPLLLLHNFCRNLNFLRFLFPQSTKKHSFPLKLSSSLYRYEKYESILIYIIFFFSFQRSGYHHSFAVHKNSIIYGKNLFTINHFVLLVDNSFLFLWDIFVYFCLVPNLLDCHRKFLFLFLIFCYHSFFEWFT